MGGTCSTYEGGERCVRDFGCITWGGGHLEDLGISGRLISKLIINRIVVRWLHSCNSGFGPVAGCCGNAMNRSRFHKMQVSFLTNFFFPKVQQHLMCEVLLIIEDWQSHSDTQNSVGLLCTSDQSDAETSTWQHTILTTDRHARSGSRTHNPSKRAATEPLDRAATGTGCWLAGAVLISK
jgi:hypothetical protein